MPLAPAVHTSGRRQHKLNNRLAAIEATSARWPIPVLWTNLDSGEKKLVKKIAHSLKKSSQLKLSTRLSAATYEIIEIGRARDQLKMLEQKAFMKPFEIQVMHELAVHNVLDHTTISPSLKSQAKSLAHLATEAQRVAGVKTSNNPSGHEASALLRLVFHAPP